MGGIVIARGDARAALASKDSRKNSRSSKVTGRRAVRAAIESLERREMLSATQTSTTTPQFAAPSVVAAAQTASTVSITATSPTNGKQSVALGTTAAVTFAAAMTASSITASTIQLRDAAGNLLPASVSYNATTRTATLTPSAALKSSSDYYTATVVAGAAGVQDASGNALAASYSWSFSTGTPSFTETKVFQNLVSPTSLRFSPDGRVFVAEKSGLIKVFDSVTDTTPTVFADLRTQVHNFWDRGLLGMTLDPSFPTKPYVYVLYAYDADMGATAPKWGTAGATDDPAGPTPTTTGATISGRLSRLTASNNGAGDTMLAGSEKVLINDWQQQFYSHSVGDLNFGSDGMLYASAGDGASPEFADSGQVLNPFNDPTNEGGALRSQDLLSPNDATSLDGSIIRVNPDTGEAVATNPNYATGHDANAKRIIAEGLRNPYRFTFKPGTNELWLGDVGWDTYEEIDRIVAPTASVSNLGWPAYEGPAVQAGYQSANLPLLQGLYAAGTSAVTTPYFSYKHADPVVAGSGEPTGGSSVTGVAFYTGSTYPSAFKNALFFCDYARQRVYVMYAGADGNPDTSTVQVFANVSGPVNLQMGPDGNLYYVDFNLGSIRRFDFYSANRPPTAVLKEDVTNGTAPLTVHFNAASSTDADAGDTLSYAWDLDGDGQFNDSTSATPTYTYTTAGNRTVSLRVTDNHGLSNTATVTISAGNTPPVPVIAAPLAALTWAVGDIIHFSGSATDAQDGSIPAANLSWTLLLHHDNLIDPANSHVHVIQVFSGVASGSFAAPDHPYPSRVELQLTATDSAGISTTTSVILQPKTVSVNFGASVAGAQISVNGQMFTAPFTTTLIPGATTSISAASPQVIDGKTYSFANWSDAGAQTHNIVAAAGTTYTAAMTIATPAQDVTNGLVYRWGMDEGTGTTAGDSISGNAGTLTHGPTWTTGKSGTGAVNFDGVDDYVATAQNLAGTLGTGQTTLTAWIKTTQVGSDTFWQAPGLTGIEQAGGDNDIFFGWLDASGRIAVQAGDGAAAKSINPVNDGQWHLVAFSRDSVLGTLQVWVDGVLNSTVGGWQDAKSTVFKSFGRIDSTGGTPHYFKGAIDDLRVYNRVLTDSEVAAINAAAGGTATAPNEAPTVEDPVALQSPVTGTSVGLSAEAEDDTGHEKLLFTWSVVGTPPAAVSFSVNNMIHGDDTVATFTKAGTYTLRITVTDAGGLSASADVTLVVKQTLSSIAVAPNAATVAGGATQTFSAVGKDQFGDALATQPAFAWAIDAGGVGTINATTGIYTAPSSGAGSATIRAASGAVSGSSAVTVSAATTGDNVTAGLVYRWKLDETTGTAAADSAGNNTGTLTNGPTHSAGRIGAGAITFDGVNDYVATATDLAGVMGTGKTTLTAWIKTTQVGSDTFWEAPGLTGVEQAGGDNDIFWGWLDASGRIGVQAGGGAAAKSTNPVNDGQWHLVAFSRDSVLGTLQVWVDGVLNATVGGWQDAKTTTFKGFGRIDDTGGTPTYFKGMLDDVRVYNRVLSTSEVAAINSGAATTPTNAAPTVVTKPTASPAAVTGKTAALSVLGADDGGEASLKYTWSVVTAPTGAPAVTFSASGTNAAKASTAAFGKAGAYTLRVTISDGSLSVTGDVNLTVAQTLTTIAVTPGSASIAVGATQAFTASALDQFGNAIAAPGVIAWSIVSGSGTINASTGVYTAPASGSGSATVQAALGAISGTGVVSYAAATFSGAKINFQPTTAATVAGYAVDGGLVYATRTGGLAYGWNVDHSDVTRDRNVNSNQLLDTNVQMKSGAKWEIAVPNGQYSVKVSIGDSANTSTNTLHVEGTSVFSGVALAKNVFKTLTVTVNVTDGKLTIDDATSAALATRLDYVEITPIAAVAAMAGGNTATRSTSSTSSAVDTLFNTATVINGVTV